LLARCAAIIAVLAKFVLETILFLELSLSYAVQPRVHQHAEGGHGLHERQQRRRGRLPRRRRREQAQESAQLFVAAGLADVADLGDGERGAWREQP
jgi:hypothetical protein